MRLAICLGLSQKISELFTIVPQKPDFLQAIYISRTTAVLINALFQMSQLSNPIDDWQVTLSVGLSVFLLTPSVRFSVALFLFYLLLFLLSFFTLSLLIQSLYRVYITFFFRHIITQPLSHTFFLLSTYYQLFCFLTHSFFFPVSLSFPLFLSCTFLSLIQSPTLSLFLTLSFLLCIFLRLIYLFITLWLSFSFTLYLSKSNSIFYNSLLLFLFHYSYYHSSYFTLFLSLALFLAVFIFSFSLSLMRPPSLYASFSNHFSISTCNRRKKPSFCYRLFALRPNLFAFRLNKDSRLFILFGFFC